MHMYQCTMPPHSYPCCRSCAHLQHRCSASPAAEMLTIQQSGCKGSGKHSLSLENEAFERCQQPAWTLNMRHLLGQRASGAAIEAAADMIVNTLSGSADHPGVHRVRAVCHAYMFGARRCCKCSPDTCKLLQLVLANRCPLPRRPETGRRLLHAASQLTFRHRNHALSHAELSLAHPASYLPAGSWGAGQCSKFRARVRVSC